MDNFIKKKQQNANNGWHFVAFLLRMRKLTFVKFFIKTAKSEQFLVRSLLDDVSVFHHKDNIGLTDGGKPVCNNEACTTYHQLAKGALNALFGARVDG